MNHNTEDTDESCLVECISSSTLKKVHIYPKCIPNMDSMVNNHLANIETEFGGIFNIEVFEFTLENNGNNNCKNKSFF
jgi:hypothetical protein